MKKYNIVLASASPRRRELLEQIGIEPIIMPSLAEEKSDIKNPAALVKRLSKIKAEDIAYSCEKKTIVIGADTVVFAGGQVLGKPKNKKDAARMIAMLSGSRHQVYTGVTVIKVGYSSKTICVKTDVDVYPMTNCQIKAYVDTGEPMDKAGAYGIQGEFAAYIKGIKGDYTGVVGLPLGATYRLIRELG